MRVEKRSTHGYHPIRISQVKTTCGNGIGLHTSAPEKNTTRRKETSTDSFLFHVEKVDKLQDRHS